MEPDLTHDNNRADISATYLQQFLAKALAQGRTLSFALESAYDWAREHGPAQRGLQISDRPAPAT